MHETKGWDVFRDPPIKIDSGSMANQACMEITVKVLKIFAYLLTFIIVLVGGVVAKGCVLFMSSQLKHDKKITYCNKDLARDKQFVVTLPEEERIAWMWTLIIAFSVPEIGLLIRSARICFFKVCVTLPGCLLFYYALTNIFPRFLIVLQIAIEITFSLHLSDGNSPYIGSGAADVCCPARNGLGKRRDANKLPMFHSRLSILYGRQYSIFIY